MADPNSTGKLWHPPDPVRSALYVVATIFNPTRSKRVWHLYTEFQKRVRDAGAILITVEAAFGERDFALEEWAQPGSLEHSGDHKSFGPAHSPPAARQYDARHDQNFIKVRVRDNAELWLKENLLNIGVQHLPPDWRYVAFVDADVQFSRMDWVSETLHALQHYDVVQMFSTAIDLSPTHEPLHADQSFMYCYMHDLPLPNGDVYLGPGRAAYHAGYAWAWRRSALDQVGGLIDRAITGPADHHMACGLVGQAKRSVFWKAPGPYHKMVYDWQEAAAPLKHNVGYIDGLIMHSWHGSKDRRGYKKRWRIIVENHYDPFVDVRRDSRGVLYLSGNKPHLRDDLRRYFRSRNPDSIDVPDHQHKIVGPRPGWM